MSRQPTLLVIDDSPTQARGYARFLENHGLNVLVATTGTEGLRLATSLVPDVVLLDLRLPDLDGTDVCRRLKADPQTQHIPVFMFSAVDDEGTRGLCQAVGADEFLHKDENAPAALIMLLSKRNVIAPASPV